LIDLKKYNAKPARDLSLAVLKNSEFVFNRKYKYEEQLGFTCILISNNGLGAIVFIPGLGIGVIVRGLQRTSFSSCPFGIHQGFKLKMAMDAQFFARG
jgi:hypothetical protein